MVLGIALVRFLLFTESSQHVPSGSQRLLGLGLVAAGGLLAVTAGVRHVVTIKRWRRGRPQLPSPLVGLLAVAVVVAAAIYALFTIGPS